MLTADSPEVLRFLAAWHENGRADFERTYAKLDYDSASYRKVAKDRRQRVALNRGDSGMFLVDKATGIVWSIKGYGVPNRKVGTLSGLTRAYEVATAAQRELPGPGYVNNDYGLAQLSAIAEGVSA